MKKIIFLLICFFSVYICGYFLYSLIYAFNEDKTKEERYVLYDLKNKNQDIYYYKSLNRDIFYKNIIDYRLKRNSYNYEKVKNNKLEEDNKKMNKEMSSRSIRIINKGSLFGVENKNGSFLIEPNKTGIIYIKDYKLEQVISSNEDKLFNVNDFEKLLTDNEYEKAE